MKPMKEALRRETIVSTIIKNGLEQVDEEFKKLNAELKKQQMGQARLNGMLWSLARPTKESMVIPKPSTKTKRVATSPAECQVATPTGKRRKNSTATLATSDWEIVSS